MAAKQTVITITHGSEALQTVKDLLLKPSSKPRMAMVFLSRFFDALSLGNRSAKVVTQVNSGDAVAATGTVTLSSFVADDTVTIGTQVFTAKVSPSGANQFALGASDTTAAAALAAKINAHTSLTSVVTATSALGVVTLTAAVAGLIGNQIGIAVSAHGSVSGSGKLTSGANPTTTSSASTFHCGV
jgi:phage tail sheath gpL-like